MSGQASPKPPHCLMIELLRRPSTSQLERFLIQCLLASALQKCGTYVGDGGCADVWGRRGGGCEDAPLHHKQMRR